MFNDEVIARSDATVFVEGNHYSPLPRALAILIRHAHDVRVN